MKKILALLLVLAMSISLVACGSNEDNTVNPDESSQAVTESAETETESESEEVSEPAEVEESEEPEDPFALRSQAEILALATTGTPSGQLIIGTSTQPDDNMIEGWSNNAANAGIKNLMSGYSTVAYTQEGKFVIDPVTVKSYNIEKNADGSKTYTFTINDNLTYNEGTKITAKDYVFSFLFGASPEFGELDADNTSGYELVGFDSYNAGHLVELRKIDVDGVEVELMLAVDKDGNVIEDAEGNITGDVVPCKTFSGIRLIDEYTFSMTMKASELPNYFETGMFGVGPTPMFLYAPGVDITDNGEGATLTDNFTTDLIRDILLNQQTGLRYKPTVTSGPYQFESFDAESSTITVVVNENFLCKEDGSKPMIQKIILKFVQDATMMDELAVGSVDLINAVSGGARINKGLDIADEGKVSYVSYPRAGYGKLTFSCNFGPTQFVEVRQAIAWCLDRDEFARAYTGGFGIVVDSYYGASMWEYLENKDELSEKLTRYTYNIERAKETLIAGGWTLNADGGDFVEGVDTIRYKDVNGELMPLIIEWCSSTGNPVSVLIATMLPSETEKIGMKVNQTEVDFPTLLENYYQEGLVVGTENAPIFHMFNMGGDFATIQAYWYYYNKDLKTFGYYNTNKIQDDELDRLANELKTTEPGDFDAWSTKWVEFQVRWNYLMPDVPLYSDERHDFFNAKLQNYTPNSGWQWYYAVVRASVTE